MSPNELALIEVREALEAFDAAARDFERAVYSARLSLLDEEGALRVAAVSGARWPDEAVDLTAFTVDAATREELQRKAPIVAQIVARRRLGEDIMRDQIALYVSPAPEESS